MILVTIFCFVSPVSPASTSVAMVRSRANTKNSNEARDKMDSTSVNLLANTRGGGSSRIDRNVISDNRELNENDAADGTSIINMNEDDLMIKISEKLQVRSFVTTTTSSSNGDSSVL